MSSTDMWYQLPADMTAWNNAIIDNISQKVPTATNYITGIDWNKLDPATGDGDGIVQLLNGMCGAPITIKGAKLAPIDIIATNFGTETKFYPFSETFLEKIYADNSLGEGQTDYGQSDEDYEGPGMRIKHIKTVDNVKYASAEAANNLLNMIVKSAKVSNWMAENMPEAIVALSNRAAEINEKLAEVNVDIPALIMIWKENDSFYVNGNVTKTAAVSDFCDMVNATIEERSNLMSGKSPIVRDIREKVAKINIPSEQDIVAMQTDASVLFNEDNTENSVAFNNSMFLTTAYLRDGSSRRGIVFTDIYANDDNSEVWIDDRDTKQTAHLNKQTVVPEASEVAKGAESRELFVCSDGYGINTNIKTDARIPISSTLLSNLSTAEDMPAIGMVGIFFADDASRVKWLGRVEDVVTNGNKRFIYIYDLMNHKNTTISINGKFEPKFYEITNEILPVVSNSERTKYISTTGITGILRLNSDGRLVLDGESHSIVNCPYALMNKYAASYEDANLICKLTTKIGQCEFESIMPEKTAADPRQFEDHTKKDNKNTKTTTDDESVNQEQDQSGTSTLSQTTPEAAMSVNWNDPEYGFGIPGAGQASGNSSMSGGNAGYVEPISSKDLDNVVDINSTKVMDAYLLASLGQGDMNARENIIKTSDVIVTALEHLSKLLFLIRQDGISFVNEQDVVAAMKKLTDVADSLGVQSSRIGQ